MSAVIFAFWVLAIGLVVASAMVISARNAVHAVLWLILAFFDAAGIFVLLGAEFLAMVLVVVYVGAVAVLFMFVVMMLDLDVTRTREGFAAHAPLGALIGVALLIQTIAVARAWPGPEGMTIDKPTPDPFGPEGVSNVEAIGRLLYTDYAYAFQAAGLILLSAIVGAIALTLRHQPDAKRQSVSAQVARERAETVELVDAPSRSGV